MIFVDTSVIVAVLRGEDTRESRILRKIEADYDEYFIPAICVQEILQGARDENQWRLLKKYLETQRIITPKNPVETHFAAARLFYLCRRQGVTVRSSVDCLIAQIVVEHDGRLLHSDRDFEKMKVVAKLKTI